MTKGIEGISAPPWVCTFWLLKPVASKLGTTSHKVDLWEKIRVFLSGKPSSSEIQFDMVAGDPWGLQLCKKKNFSYMQFEEHSLILMSVRAEIVTQHPKKNSCYCYIVYILMWSILTIFFKVLWLCF